MPGPPPDLTDRLELDFLARPADLAELLDAAELALFTVDAGGRFVAWSRGAERITGYSAAELRGEPCHLLDGSDCKGLGGLLELLAAPDSDVLRNQECRVRRKDRREVHLVGNLRVLRDGTGKAYGAVGSFTDVSDVLHVNTLRPLPEAAHGEGERGASPTGLIGRSAAMVEVARRIRLAADSDVTTLITGESGTGKELAARAIHDLSDRRDEPFVAINCAALPEALLESELFGHVQGAFTGAVRDRAGVFESAAGGTLFLDEIGDVSPLLQLKLLRVLQEREIRRVGDERRIDVDVRLLTATNRDLQERVARGRMREDFYFRIRVFDIRMPALRERADDIPLLVQHFITETARARGKHVTGIARDALEALVRYPWPGNVRELQNAIEYAMVVQRGEALGLLDLPESIRGTPMVSSAVDAADAWTSEQHAERLRILGELEEHGWNRTRTAESLGISRVTLWKKIRRYRIDEGVFRRGSLDELGSADRPFTV